LGEETEEEKKARLEDEQRKQAEERDKVDRKAKRMSKKEQEDLIEQKVIKWAQSQDLIRVPSVLDKLVSE
jgi:hypothetical protein